MDQAKLAGKNRTIRSPPKTARYTELSAITCWVPASSRKTMLIVYILLYGAVPL